ncbi:MAG: adenylosuccinate lyase [Candidatus Eisenbacteria bacterium]|nr:adenylosuccinate lyase [Candidatus Eisenbacteria bacterium]
MIERYTRPEMGAVWQEEKKYETWLEIELLVCEELEARGTIPKGASSRIREKAKIVPEDLLAIEATSKHEVVSFLSAISRFIGDDSRYLHLGLTSSDLMDTALSLQIKKASEIILADLRDISGLLKELALRYKKTPIIGRTHGVHAEPTSFGLKILLWYCENERNIERMIRARDIASVGKISGAVGNYAHLDPGIEKRVLSRLNLKTALVTSQIIQRDRHAEVLWAIAVSGASLEKFATEIRNLQRTEILEVEEPFEPGQKGSSAMPHKKNPVHCERICGLARVLRANLLAGLENISLWHERDISHSSVERIIIPDGFILLDYMASLFFEVLRGLQVFPEAMMKNIKKTGGLVFSQRILVELMRKGFPRDKAYEIVQRNALRARDEKRDLKELLQTDSDINKNIGKEELDDLFSTGYFLRNTDAIFERALGSSRR